MLVRAELAPTLGRLPAPFLWPIHETTLAAQVHRWDRVRASCVVTEVLCRPRNELTILSQNGFISGFWDGIWAGDKLLFFKFGVGVD